MNALAPLRKTQMLAFDPEVMAMALQDGVLEHPTTAHLLGGAVIGADASCGVVDKNLRVFGYENLLVCDGAAMPAMPANPGVNPSLTITALAEHAMAQVRPATSARRAEQFLQFVKVAA